MASGVLLYGAPAPGLIEIPAGAVQVSPLIPGSGDVAELSDASFDAGFVLAPAGTLERDYALAQALRLLRPGGALTALAPKDKGGARLRKALEAFGCAVAEDARRHYRFCRVIRPEKVIGLDATMAAGAPRIVPALGLWSQPGVFSWDRLDPGSALLMQHLPPQAGKGADLGCGVGVLAGRVLASPAVTVLTGVDLDRRAVACARRNLDDPRIRLLWADVRRPLAGLEGLDFVVMNPPFHDGGAEDKDLGIAFIRAASAMLRRGGVLWLVANRHLPYEAALNAGFSRFEVHADAGGYKVIEARR